MEGVPLDYQDQASINEALHSWICEHMPPRVHEHYARIRIMDIKDIIRFDMSEQDPYQCLVYVFYRVNILRYELNVLGWLTFDELYALNGVVVPYEHLTVRDDFKGIFVPPPPHLDEGVNGKHDYFWIPVNGIPRDEACPLNTISYEQIFGFIEERVRWYLSDGKEYQPVPFGSDEWNPLTEMDSSIGTLLVGDALEHFYSLPGTILDMTMHHERWTKARNEFESIRLRELFSNFKTEKRIIHLLEKNWLSQAMNGTHTRNMLRMIPASKQDTMFFYLRNKNLPPPTVVWVCPMETVPPTRGIKLPVYPPRGEFHLTYIDIFPWACQMMMNEAREFCFYAKKRDYPPRLLRIAKIVSVQYTRTRSIRGSTNIRFEDDDNNNNNMKRDRTDESGDVDVLSNDHSQLYEVAPPCIKQVMTANRFPQNDTRRYLVYMWRKAGFSLDAIGNWFQEKHNKYPGEHTGVKSVRDRFDYLYAFNQFESRGQSCATIISQTVHGDIGSFSCPYVSETLTRDIEELGNECRTKCQQPGDNKMHYNPSWLMGGRLWRIAHGYGKRDEKSAKVESSESSESSDGF